MQRERVTKNKNANGKFSLRPHDGKRKDCEDESPADEEWVSEKRAIEGANGMALHVHTKFIGIHFARFGFALHASESYRAFKQ